MNKKIIKIGFLIFIFGFIIIILLQISYLNAKTMPYSTFLIAKTHILKGEKLSFENSTLAQLDLKQSNSFFIQNSEFEQFQGKIAKDNISLNQPLLKSNFIDENKLENNIPTGKRLYILDVPIGPIVSVLKPNDSIDVIAHIDMPGLEKITETILEGVKLIETNTPFKDTFESNLKYLSFYLTPDEVKILSFIKPYSEFSIVIRNPLDEATNETSPMTFNKFIQNEKMRKILNSESFRIVNGRTLKSVTKNGQTL